MIRCSAPLPEGSPDPVLARMLELAPYQAPSGEDKGRNKEAKSEPHSLFIQPGELVPPRRRITGEKNLKFPLPKEGKGPPLKTWKQGFPNEGRNLHQRALPRRASLPHSARKGISPPPSCKWTRVLLVNISCFISENNNRDVCLVVRIVALLDRVRLRGIFFRR